MTALVCDIGGTNTRFGRVEANRLLVDSMASISNDGFDNFEGALDSYLSKVGIRRLASCCIALAGIATPDEPTDARPPCPCCGGHMIVIATFARWQQPRAPPTGTQSTRERAP